MRATDLMEIGESQGFDLDEVFNASYKGSFYGPDAGAVGGVISGTFTDADRARNVIGWFAAEKDETE